MAEISIIHLSASFKLLCAFELYVCCIQINNVSSLFLWSKFKWSCCPITRDAHIVNCFSLELFVILLPLKFKCNPILIRKFSFRMWNTTVSHLVYHMGITARRRPILKTAKNKKIIITSDNTSKS